MEKNITPEDAVVKIKIKLDDFFASIGRDMIDIEDARRELIDTIDEVLSNTDIPKKSLILQRLKDDSE